MANSVDLRRLSLTIEEASTELIRLSSADHVHRVPEIRRAHLVCTVLQHAVELAALDLVEHLAAELRVVALLVDRERAVTDDHDSLVGRRDEILVAMLLVARHQRHA